eukprot:751147-Hanusia_phi.AAC.1
MARAASYENYYSSTKQKQSNQTYWIQSNQIKRHWARVGNRASLVPYPITASSHWLLRLTVPSGPGLSESLGLPAPPGVGGRDSLTVIM